MPSRAIVKQDEINRAFLLFKELQASKQRLGAEFLKVGSMFYEIHKKKLYKYMDCDTFEEFIAMPELGWARPTVFLFMHVFKTFILKLQMKEEDISQYEISKLQMILPIVDDGENAEEWLSKTYLSRHDLRNEIRKHYGVAEQEPTPMANSIPQEPEENYELYKDYIHNRGCIICTTRPAEIAHLPRTRGAGAEDWKGIPLCRNCHIKYHNNPNDFILKWKHLIFEYFYGFIAKQFKVC